MKPIRVLVYGASNIGRGGRSTIAFQLAAHLNHNIIQCDFFIDDPIPDEVYLNQIRDWGGDVYVDLNRPNKIKNVGKYQRRRLEEILKHNAYDIMHINGDTAHHIIYAGTIAKRYGISVIVGHAHNTSNRIDAHPIKSRINHWLKPAAWHLADIRLACSEQAATYMFGTADKVTVLPNGIDAACFSYDLNMRKKIREQLGCTDKFVVGHVGRFNYQKNHEFLLNVFFNICNKEKESVLLLIGNGELLEQTKQQAIDLGIADQVIFLGNKADVGKYYQAMDVFLLPSRYEGFGIVNIEAQASGLPCLVSDTVPRIAKVTEDFCFLSLKDEAERWAEKALQMAMYHKRVSGMNAVIESGYDIIQSAQTLQRLYCQAMGYSSETDR